MKVDGPNIGKYVITTIFNGKILSEEGKVIKSISNSLIKELEDFSNEIYKSSNVKIYKMENSFLDIERFYFRVGASFSTVGNEKNTYATMNFHFDNDGNIDSITIENRMNL